MIKIKIPYLITVVLSVLLLFIGNRIAVNGMFAFQNAPFEIVRAKVQSVAERIGTGDSSEGYVPRQGERLFFEAKITSGERKGEIVTAVQTFSGYTRITQKEVYRNASILLIFSNDEWYFNGYMRINGLVGLGILFVLCVLFFGGKKGFNTILSLGLTCASIFTVFIPAILSGKNIYLMSFLVCAYVIAMTLLIVIGFNKKSLAAVAGCSGGVLATGIITIIMDRALHLTGIVDDNSRYLANLPGETLIDLKAIIFAGIIIGAMGAIMDVAISISSSLWEIKEKAGIIKLKDLFRSGLTIGRDIMGSMANTLILAYIGSSLSVVLILSVFSGSLLGLFNSEMIVVEILQALAGSFGILFAMPLTALFSSLIYLNEKNQ